MPVVFAAIAPHGEVIEELCPSRFHSARTRAAMEELGRRFGTAEPDATVVFTPHNVHVGGAMAVVVAAALEGSLEGNGGRVELSCPVDRDLAGSVHEEIAAAGIPVAAVSFGGNALDTSVMPMDWGVLVPLWYLGGRAEPPVPAVVVSPARDLDPAAHVRAGEAVAKAAGGKRVAVIASCDHGHGHEPDGPYGFDPAAAEYDTLMVDLVRENRLAALLDLDPGFVDAATADSWWQLLMLHGAVGEDCRTELLSYEAPTYYGMLCASFEP